MKSIKFWSINLFAVMTLPMILACANDNDDKSEVLNKLDKYISNIEYFDARDSDNYYYNFQYATNGKLLKGCSIN